MSDRRPEKLYDPEAAALWWNAEGRHLSIVELHEAVTDPVAAVRRGVESGTIKGEVRSLYSWNEKGTRKIMEPGLFLVIPLDEEFVANDSPGDS